MFASVGRIQPTSLRYFGHFVLKRSADDNDGSHGTTTATETATQAASMTGFVQSGLVSTYPTITRNSAGALTLEAVACSVLPRRRRTQTAVMTVITS